MGMAVCGQEFGQGLQDKGIVVDFGAGKRDSVNDAAGVTHRQQVDIKRAGAVFCRVGRSAMVGLQLFGPGL